jgi:hypothetical protein
MLSSVDRNAFVGRVPLLSQAKQAEAISGILIQEGEGGQKLSLPLISAFPDSKQAERARTISACGIICATHSKGADSIRNPPAKSTRSKEPTPSSNHANSLRLASTELPTSDVGSFPDRLPGAVDVSDGVYGRDKAESMAEGLYTEVVAGKSRLSLGIYKMLGSLSHWRDGRQSFDERHRKVVCRLNCELP